MTLVVVCALMAAAGVGLLARAVFPPRPSLSAELDQLLTAATSEPAVAPPVGWLDGVGGALWGQLDPAGQRFPALAADLAVMDQTGAHLAGQTISTAGLFALLAGVVGVGLSVAGLRLPAPLLVWLVVLSAIAGGMVPRPALRADANKRRAELRDAVAVICDLAAVVVAAGEDLDGALAEATAAGGGWAFERMRRAQAAAALSRQGPWVALGEMGERLAVDELVVLAQNVALAGQEGAKIRDALATQAKAIREATAAELEAKAGSVTERMSFPMVLLLVGFLLVIGYPAMTRL